MTRNQPDRVTLTIRSGPDSYVAEMRAKYPDADVVDLRWRWPMLVELGAWWGVWLALIVLSGPIGTVAVIVLVWQFANRWRLERRTVATGAIGWATRRAARLRNKEGRQ
jgi:hypothetical protein